MTEAIIEQPTEQKNRGRTPFLTEAGNVHISVSGLRSLLSCPRYFMLNDLLALEQCGAGSWNRDFGSLVHEVLALIWTTFPNIDATSADDIMIWLGDNRCLPQLFAHYWGSSTEPPAPMDQANLERVLWNYIRQWQTAPYEVLLITADRVAQPAVEVGGNATFEGTDGRFQRPIEVSYRMDLLVKDKASNQNISVVDHKTTASKMYANWSRYNVNDLQLLFYCLIFACLNDEHKMPHSFIIDKLSMADVSKSKCSSVDFATFQTSESALSIPFKVLEHLSPQLERLAETGAEALPATCGACHKYGPCEFLPLCYPNLVNLDQQIHFDPATRCFEIDEAPQGYQKQQARKKPLFMQYTAKLEGGQLT